MKQRFTPKWKRDTEEWQWNIECGRGGGEFNKFAYEKCVEISVNLLSLLNIFRKLYYFS